MNTTEQGIRSKTGAASSTSATPVNAKNFNQYMNVALQVSGTSTGSTVNVYLKSKTTGYPVAWSLGNESDESSGLLLSVSSGGSLPLSQFSVTPANALFQIASNGGGGNTWNFQVQCYLAGEQGLQQFELYTDADQSVSVSASLNNGKWHVINNAPSYFPWTPQGG